MQVLPTVPSPTTTHLIGRPLDISAEYLGKMSTFTRYFYCQHLERGTLAGQAKVESLKNIEYCPSSCVHHIFMVSLLQRLG